MLVEIGGLGVYLRLARPADHDVAEQCHPSSRTEHVVRALPADRRIDPMPRHRSHQDIEVPTAVVPLLERRLPWATLPVITARSTASGSALEAPPWIQRTRSAPGLRRATSSEAAAGLSPTASIPSRASLQASVPVPHPTSSTGDAMSSATIPA